MTLIDWLLVLAINGGIVVYGLFSFRGQTGSFDWYMAAKSMPWWVIGLSAFGTAIDSGDYVAIVGGAYELGLSQLSQWWLGIAVGWFALSFFVVVPMYRSGVFTNAEWLEFRFGPVARVLAVLINIQSRTNVLGNIFFSMFLVLNLVAGLNQNESWALVIFIAATAVLYIVRGGLRAGAFTDAVQSTVMITASLVLWGVVWFESGGWVGLDQRLTAIDPALSEKLLHVGGYSPEGVSAGLVIFGLVIGLTTYAVINQYEAIRFLGARSEWDFKMAALVASVATAVCLWFNVSMGPLARAAFPDLEVVDHAYPLMVKTYLPPGLVGLVLAGLIAAGYSTFDSIGIGISTLFVRDIYARFIVKDASDAHYTFVGRLSVPVIILLGFLYVPFLKGGMLLFYIRLAGAIAVPLMTVMLMGVFTRVHRASGAVGLLVGLTYGLSAMIAEHQTWPWPHWYTNTWWTYLWNVILPVLAMVLTSVLITWRRGAATDEELKGLVYDRHEKPSDVRPLMGQRLAGLEGTWLRKTLLEAPVRALYPEGISIKKWMQRPGILACIYLVIVCVLLFVWLW